MNMHQEGSGMLKQLFQQEFTKMVAVISRRFGLARIETAEDIVGETFLQAAESWGVKGVPPNPAAWLYTVAKQKTLYHFRRNKLFDDKVLPGLKAVVLTEEVQDELDFSFDHIKDSQLQMLFAVCSPVIASEAQIGLALRILCGFGIEEIAEAFFSNKETINKRLFRAKEKLRTENVQMDLPPEDQLSSRLDNVLRVIYLLFSEGYYSKTGNVILQQELCVEALRLGLSLSDYDLTNTTQTRALVALMCFHASRFAARQDGGNPVVLYEAQDQSLWDRELIEKGSWFLERSMEGDEVSSYHIEAQIAFWHCSGDETEEKCLSILSLYDMLLQVNGSPAVMLNRIYALYKVHGREVALKEALELRMENDHFYFVLLGELYGVGHKYKAQQSLEKALRLAKGDSEIETIKRRIKELGRE